MACSQAIDLILDAQDPPSNAEEGMLNGPFGPPSTAVVRRVIRQCLNQKVTNKKMVVLRFFIPLKTNET